MYALHNVGVCSAMDLTSFAVVRRNWRLGKISDR